ncbi:MAG: DUF1343 domain-containing protein [Thermoguttaceae bacterium]|nr:DUF1343 domain-containing protein [Thermoguttaceae bacterium]MDW8079376.1 DUF1343 domain-containing protein [Thermoguttaceae bacterium]
MSLPQFGNQKSLLVRQRIYPLLVFITGFVFAFWEITVAHSETKSPPAAAPQEPLGESSALTAIDQLVAEAIKSGQMPGCVVLIGRRSGVIFRKAYGHRQLEPSPEPMEPETIFDLASLTKPVATATSIMILWQRGLVDLDAPVSRYIPEFGVHGKEKVTVRELLLHIGGLPAANPLAEYEGGPSSAMERILGGKPIAPPGQRFVYSDVGFIVLGELIQRVSGKRLDQFAVDEIFRPLGMNDTRFCPEADLRPRIAPTEKVNGTFLRGTVHDPRAARLGGVAGHAGLFSTADDLWKFAHMLLCRGKAGDKEILAPHTFRLMTQPHGLPGGRGFRGLGWDVRSSYSSNRSPEYSAWAFGHGGFTGTGMWIDPENDLAVIFLSNRLHPDGTGSVNPLIAQIGTVAAKALTGQRSRKVVKTGAEVLEADLFWAVKGRRIGLITNHTGVGSDGVPTWQRLLRAPEAKLVALFAPEHGFEGKLDVAHIPDQKHPLTGIPIYSLYGKTRRPTPEMLAGLDTLVFDIQDIGTRFYTYISTMGYAMEEAAKVGIRFVVLDRPNPIGGQAVEGPVLDPDKESFVGYHRLPIRHGMTIGELAQMFRQERGLNLELIVIPMEGWQRGMFWEDTGLRWIPPSPNMKTVPAAFFYPGIGLLETTNMSVGRGTPTPFERFGAPWLDAEKLAAALMDRQIPGVSFRPITFVPESYVFQNRACHGLELTLDDRRTFPPVRFGLEVALAMRRLFPDKWTAEPYLRLLGNQRVFEAVLEAKPYEEIDPIIQPELKAFQARRWRYLLYPD